MNTQVQQHIATGLWYVLRGANAEPPTSAKPKRNKGTSGSNQVIGAFGLLIIVTSAVASLLYGPELGYNQLVSVSVGVIAGFLLSFLLMFLLVATRIYIANRRDTRRLRAAFAAGDHEAVDNILMERARRQGFTEAQYREITSKQRADLEKRFRSRIASIEAVLRRSGPIGFSAQRQIDEALATTWSCPRPSGRTRTPGQFSRLFKLPYDADGFFMEAHMKLRPLDFTKDGFFLCGLAHGPKFLEESIAQAQGAASLAMTILTQEQLWVGGPIAHVFKDRCAECLTCVRTCPFNVPVIDPKTHEAYIDPAKCQGCGVCVAECPHKAIELLNMKDEQLLIEVMAALG